MKGLSLPNKIDAALPALVELLRRSVDGTVPPLFVDYENQRVLIRSTTASAGTSVFEIALWGSITTAGVSTYLNTANFRSGLNSTGGIDVFNGNLTVNGGFSATGLAKFQNSFTDFLGDLRVTGATNSSGTSNWTSVTAGGLNITSTGNFRSAINVTGAITVTGNIVSTGTVNIKANMTASALDILSDAPASPRINTIWKDNIVKGWITFDGSANPITIGDNFNVSSITDNGVGDYTINWGTVFANASYVVVSICSNVGYVSQDGAVPTTGSTRLTPRDAAGVQIDTARNFVMSIGDQ